MLIRDTVMDEPDLFTMSGGVSCYTWAMELICYYGRNRRNITGQKTAHRIDSCKPPVSASVIQLLSLLLMLLSISTLNLLFPCLCSLIFKEIYHLGELLLFIPCFQRRIVGLSIFFVNDDRGMIVHQ